MIRGRQCHVFVNCHNRSPSRRGRQCHSARVTWQVWFWCRPINISASFLCVARPVCLQWQGAAARSIQLNLGSSEQRLQGEAKPLNLVISRLHHHHNYRTGKIDGELELMPQLATVLLLPHCKTSLTKPLPLAARHGASTPGLAYPFFIGRVLQSLLDSFRFFQLLSASLSFF